MHKCTACGKHEGQVSFYYRNGRPRSLCRACYGEDCFRRRAKGRSAEEVRLANPCLKKNHSHIVNGVLHRICNKCGFDGPESLFTRGGVVKGVCEECYKRQQKEYREAPEKKLAARARATKWRKEHRLPEDSREHHLKTKYGISIDEYNQLLKDQGGVCEICGRIPRESRDGILVVDHNHETGKVRGLLCNKCNSGLGMFCDDFVLLRKALSYMEKHTSVRNNC